MIRCDVTCLDVMHANGKGLCCWDLKLDLSVHDYSSLLMHIIPYPCLSVTVVPSSAHVAGDVVLVVAKTDIFSRLSAMSSMPYTNRAATT